MSLSINPEYEMLLPAIPEDQENYDLLKESIQRQGLLTPLIVNQDKVVLDGHRRYRICEELGIDPASPAPKVVPFDDPLEERAFVVMINLERRHLNDYRKAELGEVLLEIERKQARERQGTRTDLTSPSNEGDVIFGESSEKTASRIGVSKTTFERAYTIIQYAPDDLKEKVRRGDTSINYAYNMITRQQRETSRSPLPSGEFEVIYADPPWSYDLALRGAPGMHYETMATEQISDLGLQTANNAVLFLWATNPKLEDALKVMYSWGFVYKTNMAWVKDKVGTGYWFRGQHELLLVGTKGEPGSPLEANRFPSVLTAPAGPHSRKPEEVYEIIETMLPNRNYLELFATAQRPGWKAWGAEIDESRP